MEKEFGTDFYGDIDTYFHFTRRMEHLCGTYATIEKIDGKIVYLKDFSSKGIHCWKFSTYMIKHIDRTKKGGK